MSFSERIRSAYRVLPLLFLPLLGMHAPAPPTPVRPPVNIRVKLESTHYRQQLGDPNCSQKCATLLASLTDSIRSVLRSGYPFLDWDAPAPSKDTIEIRLADWAPLELQRTRLEFWIRDPLKQMQLQKHPVPFEDLNDFAARQGLDGWEPKAVRTQWLARMRTIVERDSDLMVHVFGKIPLNAQARITKTARGIISVNARDLRLAETTRPGFTVMAQVLDPAGQTDEPGLFSLTPCLAAAGEPGYSCEITKLNYFLAEREVSAQELTTLLNRATVTPKGLYVLKVGNAGARFHGATMPGVTP